MNDHTMKELEKRISHLESRLEFKSELLSNVVTEVEALINLLLQIIDDQTISPHLLYNFYYSILKRNLGTKERQEIGLLFSKIVREYKEGIEPPSLDEFHTQLLKILKVEEHEKANYPIEISKQFLLSYLNDDEFPILDAVAKKILDKA
ncbi:hypothetical protein [Caldifermentibacillus hisashii]|uniref:hypothetical protein n=1 Tax=Caldifermentibacillus hisashii TaxID=996558 RepID=UPI001C11BC8D|nr:hypothetical protein [Caldifermentibacillus hisashii]MBU5341600.1 hypothetical protein [Caldifermentibacillus hisashii]